MNNLIHQRSILKQIGVVSLLWPFIIINFLDIAVSNYIVLALTLGLVSFAFSQSLIYLHLINDIPKSWNLAASHLVAYSVFLSVYVVSTDLAIQMIAFYIILIPLAFAFLWNKLSLAKVQLSILFQSYLHFAASIYISLTHSYAAFDTFVSLLLGAYLLVVNYKTNKALNPQKTQKELASL